MFGKMSRSVFLAVLLPLLSPYSKAGEVVVKNASPRRIQVVGVVSWSTGIDWTEVHGARMVGFYQIVPGESVTLYSNSEATIDGYWLSVSSAEMGQLMPQDGRTLFTIYPQYMRYSPTRGYYIYSAAFNNDANSLKFSSSMHSDVSIKSQPVWNALIQGMSLPLFDTRLRGGGKLTFTIN